MSQKTKMLNRIIHYLILNASFIRDLGLLDGKMGCAERTVEGY